LLDGGLSLEVKCREVVSGFVASNRLRRVPFDDFVSIQCFERISEP